jgi:hypothetical protein
MQDFVANDELPPPILKALHTVAELSVAPTNSSPLVPTTVNNSLHRARHKISKLLGCKYENTKHKIFCQKIINQLFRTTPTKFSQITALIL